MNACTNKRFPLLLSLALPSPTQNAVEKTYLNGELGTSKPKAASIEISMYQKTYAATNSSAAEHDKIHKKTTTTFTWLGCFGLWRNPTTQQGKLLQKKCYYTDAVGVVGYES